MVNLLRDQKSHHPPNTSHQLHSTKKRSHFLNTNRLPRIRDQTNHHMIITLDVVYWSRLLLNKIHQVWMAKVPMIIIILDTLQRKMPKTPTTHLES
jgi:hypothetical protein